MEGFGWLEIVGGERRENEMGFSVLCQRLDKGYFFVFFEVVL